MRLKRKTLGVLAVVLVLCILYVGGFSKAQKTEELSNQYYPAIYENYVVWEDSRNGNLDIYGYDLKKGLEFQITENKKDQLSPAIYGNVVIWMDSRDGNWDIYGYDLLTKEEFPITTNSCEQRSPAIYDDVVVWMDERNGNWDIYGCELLRDDIGNLEAGEEFQITTSSANQQFPAIFEDVVVWEDSRHGNWDIYGYNFKTSQIFQITTDKGYHRFPAIYENTVVWMKRRNYNWDIYVYDLCEEKEFPIKASDEECENEEIPITTNPNEQRSPVIYKNIVVWYDNRYENQDIYGFNEKWDIYGFNFFEPREFQITKNSNNQKFPAIYGDLIVWIDNRNCTWNIYGYNMKTKEEFPIPESNPLPTSSSCPDEPLYYLGILGVPLGLVVVVLSVYGIISQYFKRDVNKAKEIKKVKKTKKSEFYRVNALEDNLSNFFINKWKFYFIILLIFALLIISSNYYYGTLTEIDMNSLPREKTVLLNEEASFYPALKDPFLILCFLIPVIIYYPTRKFFHCIPDTFEKLQEDEIIEKKKESNCEQVLKDFNESLKELKNRMNGHKIYIPGVIICFLLIYCYSHDIQSVCMKGVTVGVTWRSFYYFPLNSIVHIVVVLSLFLMFSILITKMAYVVKFMKELNNKYELALKPYDTDGLGGFGPLEQLWFNMISMVIPILAIIGVLSLLDQYFGTTYYSLGRVSELFGFSIFIVALLVYLVLFYYHIVRTQKNRILEDIEKEIEKHYKKSGITDKEKDVDSDSMKKIEQLQKIVSNIKGIPSLPFTTLHKTYILSSAGIPLIIQIISYYI